SLAIRPGHADTLNNRGSALEELTRHEDALGSYDAAIAANPTHVDAFYNRANILKNMRRREEAIAAYDRARSLTLDHPDAYGLVSVGMELCDWPRIEPLIDELAARIREGLPFSPFMLLALCDDPALHLACATNYIRDRIPATLPPATRAPATAARER